MFVHVHEYFCEDMEIFFDTCENFLKYVKHLINSNIKKFMIYKDILYGLWELCLVYSGTNITNNMNKL
jgi:hypothetical protein